MSLLSSRRPATLRHVFLAAGLLGALAAACADAPAPGDVPAEGEGEGGGDGRGNGNGSGGIAGGNGNGNGAADGGGSSGSRDAATAGDGATGSPDAQGGGEDAGPPGEPLDLSGAAPRTWRYLSIPGTRCRDGSEAGIAVNASPTSTRVVIALQGGGACYNAPTCGENPASVSRRSGGSAGIFDRGNAANPVANDTFVFVPYCTGDVHAGANPNGNVPGVGAQRFVGYTNMTTFVRRVKATFPGTTRVLLTGSSAGGFGASANYVQTARIFGQVPVNLVDDAGPLMRAPYLAQCLQTHWRTLWNLDASVIAACGADCVGQPDFLLASSRHAAKAYPRAAQGLLTSLEDSTIRQFFGFGADGCTDYQAVPAATFARGVADYRTAHADLPNHGVYAFPGSKHTSLGDASYTSTQVGGRTIASWVGRILADQADDVTP